MGILTAARQLILLFLPAGLSAAGAAWSRPLLFPIAALLLLFLIRALPLCRGDEVLWAVLLCAPVTFPANLPLVREFVHIFWAQAPGWILFLRGLLTMYVLFSAEALVFCVLAYLSRFKR